MKPDTRPTDSPATLVAIIVAARKANDRELERYMRLRLEQEYGVKVSFARERPAESEAAHA